jgi:hypothetical protein
MTLRELQLVIIEKQTQGVTSWANLKDYHSKYFSFGNILKIFFKKNINFDIRALKQFKIIYKK